MLTTIILIAFTASFLFIYCNVRNHLRREKLRISERPEPVFQNTPIPRSHVLAYYRDWIIALVVIVLVVVGIVYLLKTIL